MDVKSLKKKQEPDLEKSGDLIASFSKTLPTYPIRDIAGAKFHEIWCFFRFTSTSAGTRGTHDRHVKIC